MAKFENSIYNKIWDSEEGRVIMTQILNNPELIRSNHTFWAQKFLVDPQTTPTDAKGKATFISLLKTREHGNLMDLRAPLGDSTPMEGGNTEYYTGVIPDFISQGYVEKAPERMYREELFDQFADAKYVAAYATDVLQRMLDGANQTLSNMAAQALSTGKIIYHHGAGIQGNVLDCNVPSSHIMNLPATAAAIWSDTTNAKPLTDMKNFVTTCNDAVGEEIQWQIEIPYDVWKNYLLENAEVKDYVKMVMSMNYNVVPTNVIVTREKFFEAVATIEGMPKIVIIEESQHDAYEGKVNGWASGKVVFRPIGFAGYVRHTSILDEKVFSKFGNNAISRNFTPALNGLAMFMNTVTPNGNLKEWHTDLMMSAIPSLDEFSYHFIINSMVKDS